MILMSKGQGLRKRGFIADRKVRGVRTSVRAQRKWCSAYKKRAYLDAHGIDWMRLFNHLSYTLYSFPEIPAFLIFYSFFVNRNSLMGAISQTGFL
jgi:hypothetical protein